ncbi:MAG: MBL fold metallo-hydrolase [Desulfomonile tiedjei]|nr:MBL fold metallo-hydrolase [Desulfomonile tiedjei]
MIETAGYEGVTQIRMSRELDGKPVYWVAAYLVDGLLVDTGCSYTSNELASFLEGKDLRLAVNTHFHEDHVGGNHDIMTRYRVDVYAHPDSVPLIEKRLDLYPYQEITWGYPVPTEVKPVSDIVKADRYTFRVVETPGHSAGHICLAELSQGWCFTGDIFAREKPKFIRADENMGEIVRSMRKILALPTDRLVLFTAVGKIVEDGRTALSHCIDYLAGLAAKVKELERSGLTVDDMVRDVFGGEHPFAQFTNGQFATCHLVRSLLEMGSEGDNC